MHTEFCLWNSMTTTIFAVTDKNMIKGKMILLVDNIMTTGATTSEIARALKKAKTNSANVLTLCHEMPLKVINNKKITINCFVFWQDWIIILTKKD